MTEVSHQSNASEGLDVLARCPEHGLIHPDTMRVYGWEDGEGCPLLMADECDCGKPLTFEPDPLRGAVEGRERLLRRFEQLEASARVAESALANVMRQIGAARDAVGGQ